MTFEECFSFENLLKIHKKCRCGKAHKKEVIGFELNLAENLTKISQEVLCGFKVSKYKIFKIYDPKERLIEALPYRDRLVQSALCSGILEPFSERRLIYDNAACRKNKGTDFALARLKQFLRKFYIQYGNKGYFLKADISKYFASINHEILKKKLFYCNFDERVFNLACKFIKTDSNCSGKGIPLGNQTSQWFALLYLDEIDRLIKEKLQIKFYVRYMDDLILIHQDKQWLKFCRVEIEELCTKKLQLFLNDKTQIGQLCDGIDFLGFRSFICENGKIERVLRAQAKRKLTKK